MPTRFARIDRRRAAAAIASVLLAGTIGCTPQPGPLNLEPGSRIALVGGNLCARMIEFGYFETELYLRYPEADLTVRNFCDGGDTPGFRPHSGRESPWVFPGAETLQPAELTTNSGSQGTFASPDEWLTQAGADVVIGFFGFTESFRGEAAVPLFEAEVTAFIEHTRAQRYNGQSEPQLALVSPTAFENLSDVDGPYDLPTGRTQNQNLRLYRRTLARVAREQNVPFVDVLGVTNRWFRAGRKLTIDGAQLNGDGYARLADRLVDGLFGPAAGIGAASPEDLRAPVRAAVNEKNWFWQNDFKIPNGVHVFGRRYEPFGPDNYPAELGKVRELTANRDTSIWRTLRGQPFDLAAADRRTRPLPPVVTNYVPSGAGSAGATGRRGRDRNANSVPAYRPAQETLSAFTMAPGFRIQEFASEQSFPNLANPVQLSFDNEGRLWVAVMPSYPHYRPGDERPDDKLLILEDTDGDGRADRETVFASGLHLPIGFEIAPEGVYVSQSGHLKLYTDTDGDDRADQVVTLLSGFDDHDTHHAISAFTADPSGAIYMAEGVFLHSNVETAYGTVRATNGGFFRFDPRRRHLERTAQLSIPNPWGIAFDDWGQPFFAETSGPDVLWMLPGTIRPRYGVASPKGPNLISDAHRVRPTSGLEFVSSRHFPDEMQGDLLINNAIGFLGTKQHAIGDAGTGFESRHRQDLVQSSDPNFRPVDMEFAPDGSLYLVDWHNVLIGHMQHNARDPLRDHAHGRVYRITYPARPLVEPPDIDGASIDDLLDNLKLPEYRARYRSRRELRGHSREAVMSALTGWLAELAVDEDDPDRERYQLEGLWVSWGMNRLDRSLLDQLLHARDPKVRAAAVRAVRYNGHVLPDQAALLETAARDEHGRVRLEAIVAATWLDALAAAPILAAAAEMPLDEWMLPTYNAAVARLGRPGVEYAVDEVGATGAAPTAPPGLQGDDLARFEAGRKIYAADGNCGTCHQVDGRGLPAAGFPPLAGSTWVTGNEERLIKLTLHGLLGPIEVLGRTYPGQVPMTPFGRLLTDDEIAAVLTYVRNAFGNTAPAVVPDAVSQVRDATASHQGFYRPAALLEAHPMEQ